jgi:ribosome-binding factor A
MGNTRLTRVNELLRREVADTLYRVINEGNVDLATITVTHVKTSSNLRHARVLVSVRGDHAVQQNALSLLYKHRKEIQGAVNKHVTLKYTPKLSFHLDDSLQEGDNVLSIIQELETSFEETEPPHDHPEESDLG